MVVTVVMALMAATAVASEPLCKEQVPPKAGEVRWSICGNFEPSQIGGQALFGAELSGSKVESGSLTGKKIRAVKLDNATFGITYFGDDDFQNTSFSKSALKGNFFYKSKMQNVDFRNADLRGARFTYVTFKDTDFSEALLQGVRFEFCSFEKAVFDGANLTDASCVACDFKEGSNIPQELR